MGVGAGSAAGAIMPLLAGPCKRGALGASLLGAGETNAFPTVGLRLADREADVGALEGRIAAVDSTASGRDERWV